MKKVWMMILALVLATVLCTAAAEAPKTAVVVFAAASMTETMTEIEALYEKANPEIDLIFNFDSSGTLKTQIQEGAVCDLFISAGQKQMNQLDITKDEEKNPDRLDFVLVGQYTQKILAFYELNEEELAKAGKITYGSNVKEVTTQVVEGSVDCGVVYGTDAFSAGLGVIDTATAEMCGQVIYPAAVMKNSTVPEAAQAFLDYLRGEEATKIFEGVGFTGIPAETPEK